MFPRGLVVGNLDGRPGSGAAPLPGGSAGGVLMVGRPGLVNSARGVRFRGTEGRRIRECDGRIESDEATGSVGCRSGPASGGARWPSGSAGSVLLVGRLGVVESARAAVFRGTEGRRIRECEGRIEIEGATGSAASAGAKGTEGRSLRV